MYYPYSIIVVAFLLKTTNSCLETVTRCGIKLPRKVGQALAISTYWGTSYEECVRLSNFYNTFLYCPQSYFCGVQVASFVSVQLYEETTQGLGELCDVYASTDGHCRELEAELNLGQRSICSLQNPNYPCAGSQSCENTNFGLYRCYCQQHEIGVGKLCLSPDTWFVSDCAGGVPTAYRPLGPTGNWSQAHETCIWMGAFLSVAWRAEHYSCLINQCRTAGFDLCHTDKGFWVGLENKDDDRVFVSSDPLYNSFQTGELDWGGDQPNLGDQRCVFYLEKPAGAMKLHDCQCTTCRFVSFFFCSMR